jgi:hypothetical protein
MAQKETKSHFGLGFFIGFVTTLVVLAAAVGITSYVLYEQYEPTVAKKEEKLLEDYTSAFASAKTKLDVTLDYKYVEWSTDSGSFYLTAKGLGSSAEVPATALTPAIPAIVQKEFALKAQIPENDYNDIKSNLTATPKTEGELATNYGAKGIYFIANALGEETTVFKSLTLDGTPWTF